jgi:MerR family transcriptional regulator, light-induced transcriptional regulator
MRPPAGASLAILDALRDGPLCVSAVVKETGLSQSNVSNHLGRLRSVGWVSGDREGRHVLYRITDYFVEQFVRSQERPDEPLGIRARRRIAGEMRPLLVRALTTGNEVEARSVTHETLLRGLTWQDLYLLLFGPALREVGACWEAGTLTVGEEHLATAIVERLMARVYPGGAPQAQAPLVVVACVEGNLHAIGARMVADFLAAAGWRVRYLGADTPTPDLAQAAVAASVVTLSVSQPDQLPALRTATAALRRRLSGKLQTHGAAVPAAGGSNPITASLPVLVAGGGAVAGLDAATLGVDLVDCYLPRTARLLGRRLHWPAVTGRSPATASPAPRG